MNEKHKVALRHVYVRRANFNNEKSRFRTSFFKFALSVRDYSFQLYCNGNSFMQKLSNFPISKRGLMVKFARLTSTCQREDAYGLLTYCHIVRFASFLRWFHLWRVDSSPAFCLVQWHTDTQHRKDMLHKSVAAEKETHVKFKLEVQCFVTRTNREKRVENTKRIAQRSIFDELWGNHEILCRLFNVTSQTK